MSRVSKEQTIRSQELVKQIEPLLAGKGPEVQGAALLDLVATWLAGHHPDQRNQVLLLFMASIIKLTDVNEKLIFGESGFPKEGLH
jgi:hypothetical protein